MGSSPTSVMMEVIRLDEDTALKAAGVKALGGSSPSTSATALNSLIERYVILYGYKNGEFMGD